MIKLSHGPAPAFLTLEKSKELIEKFKRDGTSVWHIDELKKELLLQTNSKCAYCECDLSTESNYMEVEHFRDKKTYPDLVVEWTNLLPSCKRCNSSKSTHDTFEDPIVNPFDDNPKDHLRIYAYRYKKLTPIGATTIEVLNLNESDRAVSARFEIGEALHEALLSTRDKLNRYLEKNNSIRLRNSLITSIKKILTECQPYSSHSATAATILHGDDEYSAIKNELINAGLWEPELEDLDRASQLAAMP